MIRIGTLKVGEKFKRPKWIGDKKIYTVLELDTDGSIVTDIFKGYKVRWENKKNLMIKLNGVWNIIGFKGG